MEIGKMAETKNQQKLLQKKNIIMAAGVSLSILFVLGAFYIGKSRVSNVVPSPTPSPFTDATPTPTLTTTPTPTKKLTFPTKAPTITPTNPPAGGPTITPTPTPIAFTVTSSSATVADPSTFSGVCPHMFTFFGNIMVNAPGSVSYKWERSDGATGPLQNLTFTTAGSQAVSADTWTLGGPGASTSGWERIKVETPNSTTSNQAAFTLTCT